MKAYLFNESNNYITSPLQSTFTNKYTVTITPTTSPSRPVDFSNYGNRVGYENMTLQPHQ